MGEQKEQDKDVLGGITLAAVAAVPIAGSAYASASMNMNRSGKMRTGGAGVNSAPKTSPTPNPNTGKTAPNGSGGKDVQHGGKTVTQNNELFDPDAVDDKGRTNIQRMEKGLAPIGRDGRSVVIHHIDQTDDGPVVEMLASTHTGDYAKLHTNTGQEPSKINRPEFNKWRESYWKHRK